MATGARPCLSTGHRKQQDFPLWILPPWTLAAGIKSSASTSGPCASCKGVSREASRRIPRLLNWQLMQSATLYIRVPRTVVAPWRDIYCAFRPSSRQQRFVLEFTWKIGLKKKKKSESFLCRLVYVWLQALCIFEVQRSYPLISPKNIEALNCYYDCCS